MCCEGKALSHWIFTSVPKVHTIVILILWIRKLRNKESKECFEVTELTISDLELVLVVQTAYKVEGF